MNKLINTLIVVFAVSFSAVAQDIAQTPKQEARSYVKALVSGDPNDNSICSVVVIAANTALTAKHCNEIVDPQIRLDDKSRLSVVKTAEDPQRDLMVLTVPGLQCPCAPMAEPKAIVDETVYVVGFPYGIAKILTEGTIQTRILQEGKPHLISSVSAAPGNSGGGLFVVRDGRVYLAGIVVLAAPNGMIILSVEL